MLNVYNTLTRKKEKFEPINPPFVGMYVCGPTVYDDPHLGHAKSYVSFDVMVRFLRASDFRVRYVQNITDVGHLLGDDQEGEDRILKKARIEHLEPIEVAQKYENSYFRSMDRLNNLRPDISSRATGHIPEMIDLVQALIDKGFAYTAKDESVYFDIAKFPDYGKLSGRKIEDMQEGVRKAAAEGKRHFADFALWKQADANHLMKWNSPWGKGFPGWHLECSVMSMKYLGESVDIHGGGLDNQFPHHECEIAQSEAMTGKPFVKYWLHNNMVTVDGQKMSKSLGNFTTLDDLFLKFSPMTIRFFILQGHYRSPQDFSDQALEAAGKGFDRLIRTVQELRAKVQSEKISDSFSAPWDAFRTKLIEFMDDDFNTSGALTVLFDMSKQVQEILNSSGSQSELAQASQLFSLLGEDILGFQFEQESQSSNTEEELMQFLIGLRKSYRENKQWDLADDIRNGLEKIGIQLKDGKEGTTWQKNPKNH
ncbi:cysteine--tRNA ligase [candidate division KSB1 bacterium]|nr:cysteine--tRNA ligase [candidate division KSB1 bacterium]